MKSFTSAIALFACFCLLLLSCEKEPLKIDKENSFDIPFKATLNEQIIVQNNDLQVLFKVKNISDNRCPNHLNCLDPGEATVRIELSNTGKSKTESMLHLGSFLGETKTADSVNVQLDDRWYVISLHSVNPHPTQKSGNTQTAEICIKLK